MINVDKFLENGYYFGNVSEIFPDLERFNLICNEITNSNLRDENIWCCQYFVSTNDWKAPEELKEKMLPHTISLSKEIERKKIVDEYNLQTVSHAYIQKEPSENIINYFNKYCTDYTKNIYNRESYNDFHQSIQCYVNGSKLDPHTDSHNGSDCVLILYLSDGDWNDNGGELKIIKSGDVCKPLRGNFSLLDLTKNDVRHEVTLVTGDFKRYSFLFRPSI